MEFVNQNMQVIIAAVALLVILLILIAIFRAFSSRVSGRRGQRLGISEYHELDKTRRLVLIRRDNVEHLVLIGGPQDVVVESGITVGSIAASYAPSAHGPVEPVPAAPPIRPAPRPAVFGDRKSAPPLRPIEPMIASPRTREGESE
jgi:hypothetical protein